MTGMSHASELFKKIIYADDTTLTSNPVTATSVTLIYDRQKGIWKQKSVLDRRQSVIGLKSTNFQ